MLTHRLSSFSRRPPRSKAAASANAAAWRSRRRTSSAKRGARRGGAVREAGEVVQRGVGGVAAIGVLARPAPARGVVLGERPAGFLQLGDERPIIELAL